jgi:ferritin-like metal-binding protein YciE
MTLREIYLADLNQLLDATRQKLLEWPLLAARAESPRLRELFDGHYAQTRTHLDTLESLFERMDERPRPRRPDALNGVLDVWRSRHRDGAVGDIRELALVTTALMADYHTLPIYAEALTAARAIGDVEGAAVLLSVMNAERERTQRIAMFHDWAATRLSGVAGADLPAPADVWWTGPTAGVLPGASANGRAPFDPAIAGAREEIPG